MLAPLMGLSRRGSVLGALSKSLPIYHQISTWATTERYRWSLLINLRLARRIRQAKPGGLRRPAPNSPLHGGAQRAALNLNLAIAAARDGEAVITLGRIDDFHVEAVGMIGQPALDKGSDAIRRGCCCPDDGADGRQHASKTKKTHCKSSQHEKQIVLKALVGEFSQLILQREKPRVI